VRRAIPSILLLIIISCGSLFFRLGSLPLTGSDEPRYARIAQEMREQGHWVTPLLEGKPWLEKPPLLYWITIPLYSALGNSETAARIGSALCALIAALSIFYLGSATWSKQAGFLGAAILLTSLGFIGFGRSASTDMPFTCCLTLALTILLGAPPSRRSSKSNTVSNCRRDALLRQSDAGQAGAPWILFAYIFLGLAVLAKGPVAIILAAGIMLSVWFLDDRGGLFRKWLVIPGIVLTATVSIPWFWLAFKQNGFAFISTFLINHNFARYITAIHHHSQPFFFYLPALLALFFPWSSWLPLLISKSPVQAIRRWREWDISMVFLACWFFLPLTFFSLSDSKLAGYILPSLPPLALLMGIYISRAIPNIGIGFSSLTSRLRASAILDLILSIGMAVAAPIVFQKEYGGAWKTGLLLSTAMLIPALFSIVFKFRGKPLHAFVATLAQGLLLVMAIAQFAFPVLGNYHSTRDLAHRALELRQSGESIVTYRFFHHTLHYYTGYQVVGKLDDPHSLVQFAREHPGLLVVTDISGMKEILGLKKISAVHLADQGNFRLLRLSIQD
jgi:4-amino-4-deoxy-L-arabinose transferase-like glycosyltransferase